jgi:hypothetical protein
VFRVGIDRVGVRINLLPSRPLPGDRCPDDGERGVFRLMALVCPLCGRLLGGI